MVDARTPGYGYLGDEVLGEPDVDIEKFGNGGTGVYVIWEVDAKPGELFTILTKQVGPVNAVIGGIFVDVIDLAVKPAGKLSTTWGEVKDDLRK